LESIPEAELTRRLQSWFKQHGVNINDYEENHMPHAIRVVVALLILVGLTVGGYAEDMQKAAGQTADGCPATPPQMEGPYYPPKAQIDAQLDKDNDLTQVKGQAGKATGQILYVMGQIRDTRCRPIEDAIVEIWQASDTGRYRHPRDTKNPAPLDPQFQYWGKAITGKDGRYLFKTIKPGAYPMGPGTMRPSHIHFKVSHPEYGEFITQMYFVGDPFQDKDPIFNDVPRAERNRLLVTMEQPGADYEPEARLARFDVTLPTAGRKGSN
jgi:protocatechuate 3,4-dioxygenase beta subunit